MEKIKVVTILGTDRSGNMSSHVEKFISERISAREDMENREFMVKDFQFPEKYDYFGENPIKNQFPDFRDAVIDCDALVIVTPEYNHAFPGPLKEVLDMLLKEYMHKVAGIVAVSAGPWGGTRVIESLIHVLRELGLIASSIDLNFPNVEKAFDENGEILDENYIRRADRFLNELSWLAQTLRHGRNNISKQNS